MGHRPLRPDQGQGPLRVVQLGRARQQDPHAPFLPLALPAVRGLSAALLLAAVGCRSSDPWSGTVSLPSRIDDVRTSVLAVHGVPAGIEDRTYGRDDERHVIVRRRTW